MDAFAEKFNDFLVHIFNGILKSEEAVVRRQRDVDLSISELHLLDAVGRGTPGRNSVSDLAEALGITNSSVTIAVNKLVAKDCLCKARSGSDGRAVCITLTPRGEKLLAYHCKFHEDMVQAVAADLTEEEKTVLLSGLEKLSAYFDQHRRRSGSSRS